MSLSLSVFFISLIALIFIWSRKFYLLEKKNINNQSEKVLIKIPNFQEIKKITNKKTREYSFIFLVIIVRFSVLSVYLVKKIYKKSLNKSVFLIQKYIFRKKENQLKKTNKFLKTIQDYKKRIKKIKNKIKEEEGIE